MWMPAVTMSLPGKMHFSKFISRRINMRLCFILILTRCMLIFSKCRSQPISLFDSRFASCLTQRRVSTDLCCLVLSQLLLSPRQLSQTIAVIDLCHYCLSSITEEQRETGNSRTWTRIWISGNSNNWNGSLFLIKTGTGSHQTKN